VENVKKASTNRLANIEDSIILNNSSVPAYRHMLVYSPHAAKMSKLINVIGMILSAYDPNHILKAELFTSKSNRIRKADIYATLTINKSSRSRIIILITFAI